MATRKFRFLHILLAALAGFALVAGACTSDDSSGDASDDNASDDAASEKDDEAATAGGEESSEPDGDSAQPEDEGTDADFSATVAEASRQVQESDDACALYEAVAVLATVGNPESPEETRAAVDFYVVLLEKMAETSSEDATSEALRKGAENFKAYAESVDYDPDKMDIDGAGPQFEGSEALDTAMAEYQETEFADCDIPGMPTTGEDDTTG